MYICPMILFYCYQIEKDLASFDEVEMRHCIQVLRKRVGDEIIFADGKGSFYNGVIQSANKKGFTATIITKEEQKNHLLSNLHLGIAPTKNIDRFEWFLEKATEFGISEITPLLCSNSERKQIRPDRLEKILLSAMKQSLHAFLPKLHPMRPFEDFVKLSETEFYQQRFIAHCQSTDLPHLFNNYRKGSNVLIAIGPEGDFSLEEIDLAIEKGFQAISLGNSRLRTETAGIAAVHIINLKSS